MLLGNFNSLRKHVGHSLVCLEYRHNNKAVCVTIECSDCNEQLVEFGNPDYWNDKEETNKNYIDGVAKLLGVELGEAFKIDRNGDCSKRKMHYRITEKACLEESSDGTHWCPNKAVLEWLLMGTVKLIKLSW